MPQIPPIDDNYIDEVIKSTGPYNPAINKTQGIKFRELIKKLRDFIKQGVENAFKEQYFANIEERDAYDVVALPFQAFVADDGDGRWALYRAVSLGINADYIKISDPDLLNAVMSSEAIKTAYERNPNTNAFTDTQKDIVNGVENKLANKASLTDSNQYTGVNQFSGNVYFNKGVLFSNLGNSISVDPAGGLAVTTNNLKGTAVTNNGIEFVNGNWNNTQRLRPNPSQSPNGGYNVLLPTSGGTLALKSDIPNIDNKADLVGGKIPISQLPSTFRIPQVLIFTTSGISGVNEFTLPHGLDYTPTKIIALGTSPNTLYNNGTLQTSAIISGLNIIITCKRYNGVPPNDSPIAGTNNLTWTVVIN